MSRHFQKKLETYTRCPCGQPPYAERPVPSRRGGDTERGDNWTRAGDVTFSSPTPSLSRQVQVDDENTKYRCQSSGRRRTLTDALVAVTCDVTLLDTGATTNLIRSEVARSLKDKPEMRPYEGQLQTADGRGMDVEGCITTNLKLG